MININIYYTTFQENAIKLEKILYTFLLLYFFIGSTLLLDVKWRSEKYRTKYNQTRVYVYGRIEGRLVGITEKINAAFMIIRGIILY